MDLSILEGIFGHIRSFCSQDWNFFSLPDYENYKEEDEITKEFEYLDIKQYPCTSTLPKLHQDAIIVRRNVDNCNNLNKQFIECRIREQSKSQPTSIITPATIFRSTPIINRVTNHIDNPVMAPKYKKTAEITLELQKAQSAPMIKSNTRINNKTNSKLLIDETVFSLPRDRFINIIGVDSDDETNPQSIKTNNMMAKTDPVISPRINIGLKSSGSMSTDHASQTDEFEEDPEVRNNRHKRIKQSFGSRSMIQEDFL